jgi:hypothetical protein
MTGGDGRCLLGRHFSQAHQQSAQGKVALAKVRRMRKAGKSVAEILAWARAA